MSAAGTILGGIGGAAAVTGAVVQGQQQKSASKRAEARQMEAQRQASSRAAAELRRQEADQRRTNRKRPNIPSLLEEQRPGELTGAGSTLLTGASGVGRERMTLGRASQLGG